MKYKIGGVNVEQGYFFLPKKSFQSLLITERKKILRKTKQKINIYSSYHQLHCITFQTVLNVIDVRKKKIFGGKGPTKIMIPIIIINP